MPFNLSMLEFSLFLPRIGSGVSVHMCLCREDLRVFHNSVKSWAFYRYWYFLIGDLVTLSMSFPFLWLLLHKTCVRKVETSENSHTVSRWMPSQTSRVNESRSSNILEGMGTGQWCWTCLGTGFIPWQSLPSNPPVITPCYSSQGRALNLWYNISFCDPRWRSAHTSFSYDILENSTFRCIGKIKELFSLILNSFWHYSQHIKWQAAENLGWSLLCWNHSAHLYCQAQGWTVCSLQPPSASSSAALTPLHFLSNSTDE